MYKNITPELVTDFCEKTSNEIHMLRTTNESLVNRISALELKLEKFENIKFRLDDMNEKVILYEQKVSDLNKIMMKHFAYKANIQQPAAQVQQQVPKPSFQFNPPA
jgi:hypothetical protein